MSVNNNKSKKWKQSNWNFVIIWSWFSKNKKLFKKLCWFFNRFYRIPYKRVITRFMKLTKKKIKFKWIFNLYIDNNSINYIYLNPTLYNWITVLYIKWATLALVADNQSSISNWWIFLMKNTLILMLLCKKKREINNLPSWCNGWWCKSKNSFKNSII